MGVGVGSRSGCRGWGRVRGAVHSAAPSPRCPLPFCLRGLAQSRHPTSWACSGFPSLLQIPSICRKVAKLKLKCPDLGKLHFFGIIGQDLQKRVCVSVCVCDSV